MIDPVIIFAALFVLALLGCIALGIKCYKLVQNRSGASGESLAKLHSQIEAIRTEQERSDRALREEFATNREASAKGDKTLREEVGGRHKELSETVVQQIVEFGKFQTQQLDRFSKELKETRATNDIALEKIRKTVEDRLKELQADNTKKLEQMRATVDEKLQSTLEKRLGESFKQVSERLEKVHRGLGEMKELASGVGDLKRVMTNVKTRGTWGEVLLGNLLEQVLTPDQYEKNCRVRPRSDVTVEYAIRLPGPDEDADSFVYLPVDAKFPKESYERIVHAADKADPVELERAQKELETAVLGFARDVRDKYIAPPHTTDFAILFVPTEGLFAELLRRPGLVDRLQRDCRVNLAGPTTLLAMLNSLQMGFRTLAIQKRSSEVWKLLGGVKTEFGRFEDWIAAVQKKLHSATKEMDKAALRTRQITRRLSKVDASPANEIESVMTPELPPTIETVAEELDHDEAAPQ